MENTVRPIVVGYQTQILQEGQWKVRDEFSERIAGDKERVILDPKESYLMSEEDFSVFNNRCQQAQAELGLKVEKEGNCALCEAEHFRIKAEHALIDAMAPITKIELSNLVFMDDRKKLLDLILNLLTPYVAKAREENAVPTALAFLTVHGHNIAVKEYQATTAEGETVKLAVQSFGHLLKAQGLFLDLRHFTFAEFAEAIQNAYSIVNPRTAEVVRALRVVHERNAALIPGAPESSEDKRRKWVAALQVGDEVEVPYSLAAKDILRMKVISNNGATLRLLPIGCVDTSQNWVMADAHHGWTVPYHIKLVPPGTTISPNN
ncbi:MAG: hypothetical protein CTY39_01410 [Hyphomicrobium sp.]|nr:MAG: hypothetical protein CTY39_01410 [Hyphomicrobium sp.]